ncbi:MAG: TetR/AcrR family transcriptional regulator [Anaerolineae bacterium]
MNTSPVNRFEKRKQRTRDQLKQAAIALILEHGYDSVQVQDITDRADLGRGTFYIHFSDKEDVVWRAVRDDFDALDTSLEMQFGQLPSPRYEYAVWLRMFEYASVHRDLFTTLLAGSGSARLTERIQQYFADRMERLIQDGQCLPQFKLPPRFVAEFTSGALIRMFIWWLNNPNDYTPQQMAAQYFEMVFHFPPPQES